MTWKMATTPSSQGPFTESFDALVARVVERFHVPGLSISVVDGERTFAKVATQLLRFP